VSASSASVSFISQKGILSAVSGFADVHLKRIQSSIINRLNHFIDD
jgi:hypothetical protein